MGKEKEGLVKAEEVDIVNADGDVISSPYEIKFSRVYNFEEESVEKVNLFGMQELTAADMVKINRRMNRNGNADLVPELSLEYALEVAAVAAGLPIEFFQKLSMKDAIKVKGAVTGFIWG